MKEAAALGSCCWSLFLLLFFTGLGPSSAQSGGQQVQGIMGESVTFPVPVYNRGFLYYNDLGAVAGVLKGTGDTELKDKFRDRLQWDKQTGLFTITELKLQDEGQYKVDDSDGQKITTFQLTVYRRVSKPTVETQICSVLCSVENDRDVTLSWTRGKEILNQTREMEVLNQTSSPHLNTTLSLRLDIDIERHPETYYCEVKNPVSSEHLRVDSKEDCTPTPGTDDSKRSSIVAGSVIGALLALGILAGVAYCLKKKPSPRAEDSSTSTRLGEQIMYAEVSHFQRRDIPELGDGSASHAMMTVYDELRMPVAGGGETPDR